MVSGPFLGNLYCMWSETSPKKSPETMKPWSHAARGDPKLDQFFIKGVWIQAWPEKKLSLKTQKMITLWLFNSLPMA